MFNLSLPSLFTRQVQAETTRTIPLAQSLSSSPPASHAQTKGKKQSNKITTAKYTTITFLPKFITISFSKYANLFFLFIAVIQQINGLSPTSRYATIVPLGVVLAVSAVKELLEDRKRHQSDRKLNASAVQVFTDGAFRTLTWSEISVGSIVKLVDRDICPADMIVLSTSEPESMCYIETSNIDGETNLKIRQGVPETAHLQDEPSLAAIDGSIESEAPNTSLYTYSGVLNHKGRTIPLNPQQLLLRGSQLRNTKFAIAIVITTGYDTKLLKNVTAPPIKRTNVESMINTQILYLMVIMIVLAIICTIGQSIAEKDIFALWYLRLPNEDGGAHFRNFLTFIVLFNNLIPISLIVTVEFVKLQQSLLISADLDMSMPVAAVARTSSLVEELGQVQYIFSDKTGTLTCNEMEYMMCSIGGIIYSATSSSNAPDSSKINCDRSFMQLIAESRQADGHLIHCFNTVLAVCHTVIPERGQTQPSNIIYQAASPDEFALVNGAAKLGYIFQSRRTKSITITVHGQEVDYEILNVCEFNSTRKRMSVIVRNTKGEILLLCKGADTVIFERLRADQSTTAVLEHLESFAGEGYRTLCIAQRKLGIEEYTRWSALHARAAEQLVDREKAMDDTAAMIEIDLELLGATAIEDKLQAGVPDTIYTLQQAQIKVWVLTGDRQETAINIGYSSRLLGPQTELIICNDTSQESTKGSLQRELVKAQKSPRTIMALIIDGAALDFALVPDVAPILLDLACLCKAVICCRVSPLQKSQVVNLVKIGRKAITLAIGDGANDVGMIQAAHIGVGISGHEGLQAARSSDFSISQFRYLRKLLLVHGTWSYARLSKLILFSFYKNITLYLTQFWFALYNNYSGQTLYDSWIMSLYNVIFTVLPPLVIGMLDQFTPARMLDRYPMLYSLGKDNKFFNVRTFWATALNGFWHSILLYFGGRALMSQDYMSVDGQPPDLLFIGNVIYTIVLATVLVKSGAIIDFWTVWTVLGIPGSFLVWIIFIPIYGPIASSLGLSPFMNGVVAAMFRSGIFWFAILLFPVLCLTRDVGWKYIKRTLYPRPYHIVQEIQKYNLPLVPGEA